MINAPGKKAVSVRGGDFQVRMAPTKTNMDVAGSSLAAKKPKLSPATANRHQLRESSRKMGIITAKPTIKLTAATV